MIPELNSGSESLSSHNVVGGNVHRLAFSIVLVVVLDCFPVLPKGARTCEESDRRRQSMRLLTGANEIEDEDDDEDDWELGNWGLGEGE
jgi:hypothetical protein